MPTVLDVYARPSKVAESVRQLKGRGFTQLEVVSPSPFDEIEEAVDPKPSRVARTSPRTLKRAQEKDQKEPVARDFHQVKRRRIVMRTLSMSLILSAVLLVPFTGCGGGGGAASSGDSGDTGVEIEFSEDSGSGESSNTTNN